MMMTQSRSESPLYSFSLLLSIATYILIVAGGLVTSHDAGLAVPDWPLSFGKFFPPMVGNIFWEHGHRMIAGTVGILTLCFVITVQRFEPRIWVKRFAWAMLGMIVLQALLGGLTVKMLLPPPVSIFHGCLGQIFFCSTIAAAYFMGPNFRFTHPENQEFDLSFRSLAKNSFLFALAQLVLGAGARHTGNSVLIGIHVFNALIVVVMVALLYIRCPPTLSRIVTLLGMFLIVQVILGTGALIYTKIVLRSYTPSAIEVIFTSAHQSLGALILGILTWLMLRVKS